MSNLLTRPFALVIVDGWGISQSSDNNPFLLAHTPNIDALLSSFGHVRLNAAGEAVGLLPEAAGNAEAGHLTIGAGRIVQTPATRIASSLKNGEFFRNPALEAALLQARAGDKAVHLVGLLSDADIHSSTETIFALLRMAKTIGIKRLFLHPILDGHDVPPRTADVYLEALEIKMNEIGIGKIATVCGRHFAMDSGQNWDRTARVFTMLVHSEGERAFDAVGAVRSSYLRGIADEFIAPIVIETAPDVPVARIAEGDTVIFFNHRADGMRQLAATILAPKTESGGPTNRVVTMIEYDPAFRVPVAFAADDAIGGFGRALAASGVRNFRIAEPERLQHITAFLGNSDADDNDIQRNIRVDRPHESIYESGPELASFKLADRVIKALEAEPGSFIVVNFQAADLMSATGDLDKTVEAVQFIDTCIGGIWESLQNQNGLMLLTASHSGAEEVRTAGNGFSRYSGSTNPVPAIIADKDRGRIRLGDEGGLSDLAPTIFDLIGIDPPDSMTGRSLISH